MNLFAALTLSSQHQAYACPVGASLNKEYLIKISEFEEEQGMSRREGYALEVRRVVHDHVLIIGYGSVPRILESSHVMKRFVSVDRETARQELEAYLVEAQIVEEWYPVEKETRLT
jgi:hypothetical protein